MVYRLYVYILMVFRNIKRIFIIIIINIIGNNNVRAKVRAHIQITVFGMKFTIIGFHFHKRNVR